VCAERDGEVEAFRTRALSGEHPYLWIDATYHKVQQDGRVQSIPTVVATGVTAESERQVLGWMRARRRTPPSGRRSCAAS
jgi:transposase-like protein